MHNNFNNFIFHLLIWLGQSLLLTSNYNYSHVSEGALLADPTLLPVRLLPHSHYKHHIPTLITAHHLRKYELRDTDYQIEQQNLSLSDEELIYNMEPPLGVFQFESMTLQNYRLLERRRFPLKLSNPSMKFKLCVQDILVDTEQVKQDDQTNFLPFCISPAGSQLFNFTLYAAYLQPQYLRATIYFFIQIFDQSTLVQAKVYSRRIFATVNPNHLHLQTPHFKTCPSPQQLIIKNYQIFDIELHFANRRKLFTIQGTSLDGQTILAPTKSIRIQLQGRPQKLTIYTNTNNNDQPYNYPPLILHTQCQEPLTIDYYNIGIIPDQRMVMQVPVSLSNSEFDNITIEEITVDASSQTVLLERQDRFLGVVGPAMKNVIVAVMRIHSRMKPQKSSSILVLVRYKIGDNIYNAKQRFSYCQIRHPIAVGQKRYIDVTKLNKTVSESQSIGIKLIQNKFPIRNNLNLPIYLLRVIYDQSLFHLSWLQDRRNFIYPNHNRQQFLFSYIGPHQLPLSSIKHVILLQFNGHLFVPIQIVIYDHTLQCIYDNIISKCSNITSLDFGYFKDKKIKAKQLVIRNWNPQSKSVSLNLPNNTIEEYGINATLRIYSPLPGYEPIVKKGSHCSQVYLKGQQFIILNIEIELLSNASTAAIPLQMLTNSENIIILIRIRVQNGTIALIPQIIRIHNAYARTVQYLNLVSTFSQKYKIVSVSTNLSSLTLYASNHTQIHQNQWVGMILIYDPFAKQRNITNVPWDHQFQQKHYLSLFQQQPLNIYKGNRPIYVKVRLTTSTQLQVNSTVIVQNNPSLLVEEANWNSMAGEQLRLKRVLVKRRRTQYPSHIKKSVQKQVYQFKVDVKNSYPQTLKYKVFLLSKPKYTYLSQFQQLLANHDDNRMQDGFFCVSDSVKSKHSITSQTIKTIFGVSSLPQQYQLQFKDNQLIVLNHQKDRIIIANNLTMSYLLKQFVHVARNCFRFTQSVYIHRLIGSDLPNKFLIEQGYIFFSQFMKQQLRYLQLGVSLFQLEGMEFNWQMKTYLQQMCMVNSQLLMFKFCHNLGMRIKAVYCQGPSKLTRIQALVDGTYNLQTGITHQLHLELTNPSDNFQFQLVIANNYSKFQTYTVDVKLQEPKLSVSYIYMEGGFKIERKQFQTHYFADLSQKWPNWQPTASHLPVYLVKGDYFHQQLIVSGSRTYQLFNDAETQLTISHIGIEDEQMSCQHRGIMLIGLNCDRDLFMNRSQAKGNRSGWMGQRQPFILKPFQRYNVSIVFRYFVGSAPSQDNKHHPILKDYQHVNIYLYDQKGYHFRLTVIFKAADRELKIKLAHNAPSKRRAFFVSCLTLNGISALLVFILLTRLNKDETKQKGQTQQQNDDQLDVYRKIYRYRKLGKILKQSNYSNTDSSIGTRVQARQLRKPVHHISEDLLLSVKQVKQRELKKYFNQSEESQIGGPVGNNHHLSLSQSISYQQEEHDNNAQPRIIQNNYNQQQQELNESEGHSQPEEIEDECQQQIMNQSQNQQGEYSLKKCNKDSSSQSQLPEGEQVDQTISLDQDSWFDFNRQINIFRNKNISTLIVPNSEVEEQEYYNVFRSDIGLKKTMEPPMNVKDNDRKMLRQKGREAPRFKSKYQ